jgi:GntP family gluconate:H+ symporter
MEYFQATTLLGVVLLVVTLTGRADLPAFLALLIGGMVFAIAARMTPLSIGSAFSLGFSQTIDDLGLLIVAGCITATFLEQSATHVTGADGQDWRGRNGTTIAVGLAAGLTSSAPAALALLRPWWRGGGPLGRRHALNVTALALALSAGQVFLYPSAYATALTAILKAEPWRMVALGIPLAVVAAVSGWLFARAMAPQFVRDTAWQTRTTSAGKLRILRTNLPRIGLPTIVPLLLLIVARFAATPSEPFGRNVKELLVFISQPTVILILSLFLALLMQRRWDRGVVSNTGWLGQAVSASARPLLATGAAGGFAALLQATGMAELIAEKICEFRIGVMVPLLTAATLKLLQGSPMVTVLTAAGMLEPLLTTLGLGDAWGRALAAGGIGAGLLISHINDPLFWLVADIGKFKPAAALALFTMGTVMQASVVALFLLVCRYLLVFPSI